jgi:hypothetical protein
MNKITPIEPKVLERMPLDRIIAYATELARAENDHIDTINELNANLASTQTRCTELLNEVRLLRRESKLVGTLTWQFLLDATHANALARKKYPGPYSLHPASSNAWAEFGLERPLHDEGWTPDPSGGYTCEVWQSAYGHRARKRTWLGGPPMILDWARKSGTAQVGWFDRIKPTLSKKDANATPPRFRDALIALARHAGVQLAARRS